MSIQTVQDIRIYKYGAWHSIDKAKIYKDAAFRVPNAIAKGGIWYKKTSDLMLNPFEIYEIETDNASLSATEIYYCSRAFLRELSYNQLGIRVDTNNAIFFEYSSNNAPIDLVFSRLGVKDYCLAGNTFPSPYIDGYFEPSGRKNIERNIVGWFNLQNPEIQNFSKLELTYENSLIDTNHSVICYIQGSNINTSGNYIHDFYYNENFITGFTLNKTGGAKIFDVTSFINTVKNFNFLTIRFYCVVDNVNNAIDTIDYNITIDDIKLRFYN